MVGGVAESTSESGGIGVTDVDRIRDIRSRHFREGQSIRQIARDMGMSRRTIRRYIQPDGPWGYTLREPRPRPVAEAIEPIVREIIENDQRVLQHAPCQTQPWIIIHHHDHGDQNILSQKLHFNIRE